MKTQEIEIMSKKEEELVDILQQSGFDIRTAKTLIYMLAKKTARTIDIERAMYLRQPDVSVGTNKLLEIGILSVDASKSGRGRPLNLYTLNKSVSDIKDFLIKGMREEIKKTQRNIEVINNFDI